MSLPGFINADVLVLIGTIAVGLVYVTVAMKRGSNDASRESNEILRGLIEDQKSEIVKLRERMHSLGNDMQKLQVKFEQLSAERKQLSQLVVLALAEHFAGKPDAVRIAQALVSGDGLKEDKK